MNHKIATKQIEELKNTNGDKLMNGELISPAVLAGYSKIMPGAPERILAMTEDQLRHRQWLEKLTVCCNSFRSLLGLILAAVLTFCFLAGGVLCIMYDHDYAGTAIIGSTLLGLVTTFVYGTKTQ